ncbi:MAG TPA: DcrB-related protein, partial [Minicystis sp.]|nr:DcrB-related protein [Minicystis sp.]
MTVTYHMNDMTLEIPSTYADRSVNVLANPTGTVSINIARDALPDEPLVGQIRRELTKWSKRAPRFFLLSDKPRQVGSMAGHEMRFQWMPQNVLFYQHQVYVPYYGRYLT